MNIGERIKSLRKDSGLTQKQLGEKIGISEFSVRKYESGDRTPSTTTLKVIGRIFNLDVNDPLFDGMSEQEKKATNIDFFKEAARERGLIKDVAAPPQMDNISAIFKDALIDTTNNIVFGEKDGKKYLISKREGICVEINDDTELDFTTDIVEYISFKAGQIVKVQKRR